MAKKTSFIKKAIEWLRGKLKSTPKVHLGYELRVNKDEFDKAMKEKHKK